jgi:hypothetical protein
MALTWIKPTAAWRTARRGGSINIRDLLRRSASEASKRTLDGLSF